MSISQRKLDANRQNAQVSTGPRTTEGKSRSRLNGCTHGIFCKDLVLPGEDASLFQKLRRRILLRLRPRDSVELMLVDRIVSAAWRLRRLQEAEATLHHARTRQIVDDELKEKRYEATRANKRFDESTFDRAAVARACSAALVLSTRFDYADVTLERLSRYEQRLEFTIHRCLRDLHNLRARRENESQDDDPLRAGREAEPNKSNMQTEPTNPSNLGGLVGSSPSEGAD